MLTNYYIFILLELDLRLKLELEQTNNDCAILTKSQ